MAQKKQFEFLEDIATADAAYIAYGSSLPELLSNAAAGLFATMVDLDLVPPQVEREIEVEADDREELLYNWLAELIYAKDVHAELYSSFEPKLHGDSPIHLTATVRGIAVDKLSGSTSCDVKAVTYHRFAIEDVATGLRATVVLDL